MKLKEITLATAALSALSLSGSALAAGLDPASIPDAFTLRFAGASAVDNLIFDGILKDMCAANISVLNKPDATKTPHKLGNYFGVACTAKTTAQNSKIDPSISGQNILVLKRSAGGSAFGVNNLLTNPPTPVTQINPASCVLNGTYTSPTPSVGTVDNYTCSNTVPGADVAADAGISDVNPEMFKGVNRPAGFSDVKASDVAPRFGRVKGVAAQVFGIVVTKNLRDNLQVAQFGAGNACVGAETEACMPNLSRQLVESLLAGRVTQWNQIKVKGTAFTSLPGVTPPTPVGGNYPVKICRRVPGSGTQAAINANIHSAPCTAGAFNPLTGNTPNVAQGSGSSDVATCLQAWNTGTALNIATDIGSGSFTVGAAGTTGWAIGPMGLEKADANMRFVKLDSYAPTLANVHAGKYPMWAELTVQYRTDAGFALTGAKLGLANTIKSSISNASNLASLNALLPAPAYLALSTNSGQVPDAVFNLNNPVVGYTHTTTNTDNCRIPSMNPTHNQKTPGF